MATLVQRAKGAVQVTGASETVARAKGAVQVFQETAVGGNLFVNLAANGGLAGSGGLAGIGGGLAA